MAESSWVPGGGGCLKTFLGLHYTLASDFYPFPLSHEEDKVKVSIHRRTGGGLAEEPGDTCNRGCAVQRLQLQPQPQVKGQHSLGKQQCSIPYVGQG